MKNMRLTILSDDHMGLVLFIQKLKIIKTAIIEQEVPLMITPFSKKELCARDASKGFHARY